LPLTIKNSSIEGAGMGVFATSDLPKNSIILTYLGVIYSNFSLKNYKNDSLYSLGWLLGEGKKLPR
jgi:hypothetical protein